MPNSALTLFDATLALYPAGEDGVPALDLPLWLGACAERLRLSDEFISVETRPTGRSYPKHHPLVLTHQIDINRVWVSEQQAESFRVFAATGGRFVLDVLWEEEGSTRWFRRTYYGVTLRSDGYESNDLNSSAGHFMEDQSFTAEYFIEASGVGEVSDIDATLPLYVQWVGPDGTFPLYNFAGGDFVPVSDGITDDRMAIGSGSLHFSFDEEDPAMSLIDGDAFVTTGFFKTAPDLSAMPRVEFMRGNRRLASLDKNGRFFAPSIVVSGTPTEDEDDTFTLYSDAAKTVPVMSIAAAVTIIASIVALIVTPDSVPSEAAIGEPTVRYIAKPTSLPSGLSIGEPTVNLTVRPDSVPSALGFGTVYVFCPVAPASVASSLSIGTAHAKLKAIPAGVASAGAVGAPQVNVHVAPNSVASSLSIGSPIVPVRPNSVPSSFAAGSPTLINLVLNPDSVPSSFAAGLPTVSNVILEDMPLNSAVYEPGRDKIFATRGGYIYQLNATTGARESVAKIADATFDDSSLVYFSGNDRLYVSVWRAMQADNYPSGDAGKLLLKIHPDTFAIEATYDFVNDLSASLPISGTERAVSGPRRMLAVGSLIYIQYYTAGSDGSIKLFTFDPATETLDTSTLSGGTDDFEGTGMQDVVYDADHSLFFMASGYKCAIRADTGAYVSNQGDDNGRGIAYRTNYLYTVNSSVSSGNALVRGHVYKWNYNSPSAPVANIDLGIGAVAAWRIRYNPNNDRLYIPAWTVNSVVIVDPNTDTVESVATGFDSPFDVVFTPTKAFAVQHGPVGLLEIT